MRRAGVMLLLGLLAGGAVAAEPPRWVSAGGALSEWVVELGGEARLVGVDSTSQHPQRLRQLPNVGYQRQLAAEGILALSPAILLGTEEMGPPPVLQQLSAAGVQIEVLSARPELPLLQSNLERLGQLMGDSKRAELVWRDYARALAAQQQRVSVLQAGQGAPSVLMLLGHAGGSPLVAGQGTAAGWLIEQAGGRNLGSHAGYKPVSTEALLELAPQVLLVADRRLDGEAAVRALLQQNPVLRQLPAVRDGQVFSLDPTLLVGGLGPRLPEALARLTADFYPADPASDLALTHP